MKKTKSTLSILIIIFCISMISNTVFAEPTVDDISVDPAEPTTKSTVTVSADLSGNNIEEVRLRLKECNDVLCHRNQNLSMTETDGTYQASYTLEYDDSTYIEYWLEVKSDGNWYSYIDDSTRTDIVKSSTPDPNNNGDSDNGSNSPGFEIILLMLSLVVVFFIYNKKMK